MTCTRAASLPAVVMVIITNLALSSCKDFFSSRSSDDLAILMVRFIMDMNMTRV